MGEISWGSAPSIFGASEINDQLDFYKNWYFEQSNTAPYFASTPGREVNEREEYSYTVLVIDDDGNTEIDFEIDDLPSWLTFEGATSRIFGTPTQADVGTHSVKIKISDGIAPEVEQVFSITVQNVNDAPEFTFTAPTSTDEDASFSYQLTASDIDADVVEETLTYVAVSAPSWMTVSSSGLVTGTPGNEDAGVHDVTVRVTDSAGATDTKTFTLTVNNTNDAPEFTFTAPISTDEDASFSYQL
ncbi:MAG: putative Ig domain-containing protein, partial [Actinomycetota bacterium]|nr:putative Ig domain-containing protein [Actinomycetota bacterium]